MKPWKVARVYTGINPPSAMKTHTLPALAFLAALALLPQSAANAATVLTAAGILLLFISDSGRAAGAQDAPGRGPARPMPAQAQRLA